MKCVKCGLRKGKRACPALKGDICPQCCGEHRLKEIACPADCSWLGGLAVLAQGAAGVDALEVFRALHATVNQCALWSNERASDELKLRLMQNAHALLGGKELNERDEWLGETLAVSIYYNALDAGQKPLDAFLDDRARDLSTAEVAAARLFATARPTLVRVEGTPVDRDGLRFITILDVVSGDKREASFGHDAVIEENDLFVGHVVTQGSATHVAFEARIHPELQDGALALWKEAPGATDYVRKLRDSLRTSDESSASSA
jgi:hypothetical protein